MTSLRKALDANDLESFIAALEADDAPPGDAAKLARAIASMLIPVKSPPVSGMIAPPDSGMMSPPI